MKALWYISRRKIVNHLKGWKKKPQYLILGILLAAYAVFLITILIGALIEADFESPYLFLAVLTAWTFYSFFGNFASYAKRKGVIFYPSHAHFIFTAPIRPKVILLYGAGYNFIASFLVTIAFVVAGLLGFRLSAMEACLLFGSMFGLESILEGSIIILLYANERFKRKTVTLLARMLYVLLAGITLFGIWYFKTYGFTLESVVKLIDFPALQMLPVVGWNVSLYRLILLGPETWNLICSGLYILTVLIVGILAAKMKCSGGYYEDAAKFADDYAQMKARKNSGEMVLSIGGKKKFKKATIRYKATGAKAIFYRQVLEYKKEKWFIFSYMTVFCICADILVLKVIQFPDMKEKGLLLLGIVAYLVFLTSGYMGKWDKELKNPYLYLIPDSPAKKMWYATAMEHLKAAIDGAILIFPIGIGWEIGLFQMISLWFVYIAMQAIKLYVKVLVDSLLKKEMGETIKQLIRMTVQGGIIGIGILLAVFGVIFTHINFVFLLILIYGMIMAAAVGLLTVSRFAAMEQFD